MLRPSACLLRTGRRRLCDPPRLWSRSPANFSTAAFTLPAHNQAPEQTLFVVGLNEGKFFGQDGAEEGLKLLERVADHHKEYEVLFGLNEKELARLEDDYRVRNNRLTPSRDLEGVTFGEVVPVMQASIVDKAKRRAMGRPLKTTTSHVAWMLWKHPREALRLYWAYWKRNEVKDAARRKRFEPYFPNASYAYFDERAQVIAINSLERLLAVRANGRQGTFVLVLGNDIFEIVAQNLRDMLGEDGLRKLLTPNSPFLKELRERATHLRADVPDLTPVLIFVYACIPILIGQFLYLGTRHYIHETGAWERFWDGERRD